MRLQIWDIISIQKTWENTFYYAIILSKQVLFWGNFCAFFEATHNKILSQDEFLNWMLENEYWFKFIDFYDALKDNRVTKIGSKYSTQEIFAGKIKTKEYLEDIDETSGELSYSNHNNKDRIEEKEIEDLFVSGKISISPILIWVIQAPEVEEYGYLELLAFQEDIVREKKYFYSIKEIDKIAFTPLTMVKPKFQTKLEKQIPEVAIQTYLIDLYLKQM